MSRPPLIEASQIVRRDPLHGRVLLHGVDFALRAGERVGLSGPSGSGKSVFLRALALLDPLDPPHDGGHIDWRGERVTHAQVMRYRRHVAYLRQRPALLDGTVGDNLRYPYSLRAYRDVAFDPARVRALFAATGRSADLLLRQASELSGGEAQIVALVRVLQLDPQVLLLDEPTASLDPEAARAIETLVQGWFDARPMERATVWVSHDPAQVRRAGTRQLTMNAGVLKEVDPVS